MLTPRELLQTRFRRAWRGYKPREVDEFVRRLVGEYESVLQENSKLKLELAAARGGAGEVAVARQDTQEAAALLSAARSQVETVVSHLTAAQQEASSFHRRMRSLLQEYLSLVEQGEQEAARLESLVQTLDEKAGVAAAAGEDEDSQANCR